MRQRPPADRGYSFAVLAIAVFAGLVVLAIIAASGRGSSVNHRRTIEGIGVQGWHARAVRNRRTINQLRHVLLTDPHVVEAVNLAAATYGDGATLWRKARCETGGTYDPRVVNSRSGAAGLFQFMPSTWRSTPYGRFSVFSPYANALAAGWMHSVGRGGEWACR